MFKKLLEKRAALRNEMTSIINAAEKEERAITEAETARFNELETEIRAIDDTIAAYERSQKITDPVPAFGGQADAKDTAELRAQRDEEMFADYIMGRVTELRAGEQNMTMSNNGAIIPETIANRIIDAVVDLCPILAGAELYHVKGTLKIPKWTKANTTHDITVGYATEFTALTADSGKFTSVDLGGFLAGALTLIGMSVENNGAVNVVAFVITKMASKIAEFIERELLRGTGTNAAQGALSSTNTVTAASAAAIVLDDLIKLQSAVKQVYQKNACWTMHPNTFTAIKLLKDGENRPLIQPDPSKEFPFTLLGKPVYLSDNMPAVAASAKSVLYGDYSGLSTNFREDISIQILREKYAEMHALGVIAWFEFDSRVTDEQKLAVLVQKAS